jgi:hypothetical protein
MTITRATPRRHRRWRQPTQRPTRRNTNVYAPSGGCAQPNPQTGDDLTPPVRFLPLNAKERCRPD